jgi:hypothetical protein
MRVEHHVGTIFDHKQDAYLSQFMYRYYREIGELDLDIGLAPLEPSVFNGCKSNIRMFEYGMNGIPVVASRYGPYDDWPAPRADNPESWFAMLEILIKDEDQRRVCGQMSLEHLRSDWTEDTILPEWEAAWLQGALVGS